MSDTQSPKRQQQEQLQQHMLRVMLTDNEWMQLKMQALRKKQTLQEYASAVLRRSVRRAS